jgi:hypothetical protein
LLATVACRAVKKKFSATQRSKQPPKQKEGKDMAKVRGATATRELRKNAGGGKFLTLKDGDEYEVCFAGVLKHGLEGDLAEPLGVEVVWIDGSNGRYSVEYDPNVHDDADMRVSFMWNVLVRGDAEDGSQDEMKILQQGPQFFDAFIKHKNKKGYGYWFTVGRTGSGQFDTRYSLDREDKIPEDEIDDIKQMSLHDLDKESSNTRNEGGDSANDDKEEKRSRRSRRRRAADAARTTDSQKSNGSNGGGLSESQVRELKAACMALPDPPKAQEALKGRLNIAKISEIAADQFDDAMKFVANIAAGEGNDSEDIDDPFFS